MEQIIFYALALVAIVFSALTVGSRNAMYSVLYLIVTFFAMAGFYLLLSAEFVAIVHIIVYAGAIMVLFLFTVMMLNLNAPLLLPRALLVRLLAVIAGGSFALVLIAAMGKAAHFVPVNSGASQAVGTVKVLGKMLFNEFLLPFELTSVLFIATMVGVVVLTKKEE